MAFASSAVGAASARSKVEYLDWLSPALSATSRWRRPNTARLTRQEKAFISPPTATYVAAARRIIRLLARHVENWWDKWDKKTSADDSPRIS